VGGSDSPAPAIGSPTTESLGVQTATLVGVLAWCSFIHLPPNRILVALAECARAVWTGGGLAVGFFTGRRTEPFDHAVTTAYRWPVRMLRETVETAGFEVGNIETRTDPGARPHGALLAVRERPQGPERRSRTACPPAAGGRPCPIQVFWTNLAG